MATLQSGATQMTKTVHALFTAAALIIATSSFAVAAAENKSSKSCGGSEMTNKQKPECANFKHHRHHMKRHHSHMMKKY